MAELDGEMFCELCGQKTDCLMSLRQGDRTSPRVCSSCFTNKMGNRLLEKIGVFAQSDREGASTTMPKKPPPPATEDPKKPAEHGVTESRATFHAVLGQLTCPPGKPIKIALEIPVTESIHFDTLRRLQTEKLKVTLQADQVDAFRDRKSEGDGGKVAGKGAFPQTTIPGTSGKDASAGD